MSLVEVQDILQFVARTQSSLERLPEDERLRQLELVDSQLRRATSVLVQARQEMALSR